MKIVRLGMTEAGLLVLSFASRYCNTNAVVKQEISRNTMNLVNWLYTTSGYYDKSVKGNHFNFDHTALNKNFITFIGHLEQAVGNAHTTNMFLHEGFIMNIFNAVKDRFIQHYNIKNLVILNGTVFVDRIPGILSHLKDKKVLVVSPFDGLIKQQYDSGNVYKIYDTFPVVKSLDVIKFPYCFFNDGPHNNYHETLEHVFQQIKQVDFDIVLFGCGSYGHMLCHKVDTELNKEAMYIGGSLTVIFGILATREKNHCNLTTNEYWIKEIPDSYKPPNYKLIEGGCYW